MASPMPELGDHLLIPVDANGNGPVRPTALAHHWACWCGEPRCPGPVRS